MRVLNKRLQILLICAITLAVFSPAAFGEFSRIDDPDLLSALSKIEKWNLADIFIPKATAGLYYRPLNTLSFIVDKELLFLSAGLMHLLNIFLHLANTLLIFAITLRCVNIYEPEKRYIPFAASLMFALHPLTTESVNWISARTDILAGFFILITALFLILYKQQIKSRYIFAAMPFFLLAILSKEVAIAFIIGAIAILMTKRAGDLYYKDNKSCCSWLRYRYWGYFFCLTAVIAIFFFLRSQAYISNYSTIGRTLTFISNDLWNALFVCLRAFGFYIKKILIPYPLNFAIMEVDPLYELLAIPAIIFCIYTASRKSIAAALFTGGIFMIIPSFVLAFNHVAWTPYAERYLYIPSAFAVTSFFVWLANTDSLLNKKAVWVSLLSVLMIFATMTTDRNITWQSNITLLEDTAHKSPYAQKVLVQYAALLDENNQLDASMKQAELARKINLVFYDENPDIIIADILTKQGKINEAISRYEYILKKTDMKSALAFAGMIEALAAKRNSSNDIIESNRLTEDIINYNLKLFRLNGDSARLYMAGQEALSAGKNRNAMQYFAEAHKKLPQGHFFKEASGRLAINLSNRKKV